MKTRVEMTEAIRSHALANLSSFVDPSSFDIDNLLILPGFCDVHVHFREPGFSYKETIKTGSASAARGGYTAVMTMPNLSPVPDSVVHLEEQLTIIERDATIDIYPYGAITVGQMGEELSDMEGMAERVIAFSDDGKGVQSEEMMREAMLRAKSLGKIIVAHCEVNALLRGGYIHDGVYAKAFGHRGISSASEYEQIRRDIRLVEEIGVAYHVCHVSTKESVALIREAKRRGVNITCETGPHYLILNDQMIGEEGRYKMNPPIRSEADRIALVQGILDGTIDMIATDHAPHSEEEKSRGLEKSAFGIVGLETAFPLLYTYYIKTGILSLERALDLLVYNPRERFGLPIEPDGFSVWDVSKEKVVRPEEFLSMGHATPFEGWPLYGENLLTVCRGKIVYQKNEDRIDGGNKNGEKK